MNSERKSLLTSLYRSSLAWLWRRKMNLDSHFCPKSKNWPKLWIKVVFINKIPLVLKAEKGVLIRTKTNLRTLTKKGKQTRATINSRDPTSSKKISCLAKLRARKSKSSRSLNLVARGNPRNAFWSLMASIWNTGMLMQARAFSALLSLKGSNLASKSKSQLVLFCTLQGLLPKILSSFIEKIRRRCATGQTTQTTVQKLLRNSNFCSNSKPLGNTLDVLCQQIRTSHKNCSIEIS